VLVLAIGCSGGSATPTETEPTGGATTSEPVAPAEGCWTLPPAVTDDDYIRGDSDAPVTIIEYADFQ
jgi:hypothetical protein